MKEEKLYRSLEFVRDEYLEDAADAMRRGRMANRFRRPRVWIIAACMVLAVVMVALPIANLASPTVTERYHVPPFTKEMHFTASDIANLFKGDQTDNGGTNQYTTLVVSDASELTINELPDQEYLPIYEYLQTGKDLSKDDFSELLDDILPRLCASLSVPEPEYEIESDQYFDIGKYYETTAKLGNLYHFNASQQKKYEVISIRPTLDSSRKMFLDGEQITARLSQTDEEIIASLEGIKEKLFEIFGVVYTDVKVRRDYSAYNENSVDWLYIYFYNESEHVVRPFVGNRDSNYIALEFDNFANWSDDIVSDDLLEVVDIVYVRQRTDPTKFYTVTGKAKMIPLERAEELLAAGYVFGGHSCKLCMEVQEKIDFSDYDYVSISYVLSSLFSDTPVQVVPFYVFYKYIGETENGNQEYAKTYVPAVEVSGLDEYFENQVSEHTSS